MIPAKWRDGEVAVLGLKRTGIAAALWLARNGFRVYASDSGSPEIDSAAEDELRKTGVSLQTGGHDADRLRAASVVVVSPGIPPQAAPLEAARSGGVHVIAELELAAMAMDGTRLAVITGTNGKTTTTELAGAILKDAGFRAVVAGNIGEPLISCASLSPAPEWAVVEASSFQLHDCHEMAADIGVLTNLSPDHLDRYSDVGEYYEDKKRLFRNASENSLWVLPRSDEEVDSLARGVVGRRQHWTTADGEAFAGFERASGRLTLDGADLMHRHELDLLGDHNVANALAAAIVANEVGVSGAQIAKSLRAARPLEHRLEMVRTGGGIRWINDSKATNVSSTAVALDAMTDSYVLILGGRHKGEPYSRLLGRLGRGCVGVVAFGEAAPIVASDLKAFGRVTLVEDLASAVRVATDAGADTVLLSPACSSFDQFDNYEQRGREFKRLVGES